MQLQEFFDYKNQLMGDILTNESLVKLIDDEEFFGDNPEGLAYTHVFPFEYIPETVQDGRTFVCIEVDVQDAGKTYYMPVIYVWVFSHRSRLRLPEGGVRTDKICSKICEMINGSRFYGMGELNFHSAKRFAPMTDYNGKMLTFYAKDFSKQFVGNKPTPTNRKNG